MKINGLPALARLPKSQGALAYKSVASLEATLVKKGAFSFLTAQKKVLGVPCTVLRASETDMWPMGTHYWTRDNAICAHRLMNCVIGDKSFAHDARKLGKRLLLSSLHIMSTPSQLERMRSVVGGRDTAFARDRSSWPQIFLQIRGNLDGQRREPWAHKQDAFQILAYYTLDALERGTIDIRELSAGIRQFLALIPPFLAAVDFERCPNSGSWEELESIRSSVIAWDLATLDIIARLQRRNEFAFLRNPRIGAKKSARSLA